jgi:excisionase family DNA binding protein
MALRALKSTRPPVQPFKVMTVTQLLTPQQLADYWQIEVDTIYTWVSQKKTNGRGEVLPFRKVGSLLRFDFDECVEWAK